jgi:hypothetical protein
MIVAFCSALYSDSKIVDSIGGAAKNSIAGVADEGIGLPYMISLLEYVILSRRVDLNC